MKTAELTGAQLDYWVGRANGWHLFRDTCWMNDSNEYQWQAGDFEDSFKPSTEWAQGGPIIEREGMGVAKFWLPADVIAWPGQEFAAISLDDSKRATGPTMLIAAMRLYVASKYGDEVPG